MKFSLARKLASWASVWMVIRSDPTVVIIRIMGMKPG